ncbi:hypothetical protein LTR95_016013 [Oleoguttula sp. CCFEE 5521]
MEIVEPEPTLSTSACAQVLSHANCLHLIAAYLPQTDIATVRSTNRTFHAHFSRHLFRRLRLRFSSWYMERLKYISEHKTFASSVRELVFDTATYLGAEDEDVLIDLAWDMIDLDGPTPAAHAEMVEPLDAAAADDKQAVLAAADCHITDALGRLTGCRKLIITTWSGPGEHMFDRASVLGAKNFLPPPLATLRRGGNVGINQMLACIVLIPNLADRNRQFAQITIRTSDRNILGHGKGILELPSMTPIAFRLATAQDPEPTPLRTLRLKYTLERWMR